MEEVKFNQKWLTLQENMLNFAYILTSNREDAYDLLQDTILKVLANEDKYVENTNFKGWVFTIMRNIFINNYRRTNRISIIVDNSNSQYQLNQPTDSGYSSPEDSYTIKEINNVIKSFPETYRIPFSMFLAGYHYTEIASKMNLPVGTVKSRIFYARQKLRQILKDYSSD